MNLESFLIEQGVDTGQLSELVKEKFSELSLEEKIDILKNSLDLTDEDILYAVIDEEMVEGDCLFNSEGDLIGRNDSDFLSSFEE